MITLRAPLIHQQFRACRVCGAAGKSADDISSRSSSFPAPPCQTNKREGFSALVWNCSSQGNMMSIVMSLDTDTFTCGHQSEPEARRCSLRWLQRRLTVARTCLMLFGHENKGSVVDLPFRYCLPIMGHRATNQSRVTMFIKHLREKVIMKPVSKQHHRSVIT